MNSLFNQASIPIEVSDIELLRCFEPVVRFTKGESFYPMDVERYIQRASLWLHHPDGREELLIPEGDLTIEKLVEPHPADFGSVLFLRLIGSLSLADSARVLIESSSMHRQRGEIFNPGLGRLARGGLLPRIGDALFSLSLLLRGRVPGATAAAARIEYDQMQQEEEKYVYYGRVVRQGGWVILQYWFFYAFNNWRSGFHGVNDHETDWETILVYLYEQDGRLYPEWAGYASHDFHGADLRRRWDDRDQLDIVDSHPVVYAGAGSHASYFRRGEYQAEINLPVPPWLSGIWKFFNRFWTEILAQSGSEHNPFRIPFVDYARGDGKSIGPAQSNSWTPVLVDETTPWVGQFRGLWGLFARDPISGENAPAGPMYNRDGSPRDSWYDPLGFVGLDRTPPPPMEKSILDQQLKELHNQQQELEEKIKRETTLLQQAGLVLDSMKGNPHLSGQFATLKAQVDGQAHNIKQLRREYAKKLILKDGLHQRLEKINAGQKDSPHAHILHLAIPETESSSKLGRLVEAWAALSVSLLLFGMVALLLFFPQYFWVGFSILIAFLVVIESLLRGTFAVTLSKITALLALVSTVILLINFWMLALIILLTAFGIILLLQKLQELRST